MEDDENFENDENLDEEEISAEFAEDENDDEEELVRLLGADGRTIELPLRLFQLISGNILGRPAEFGDGAEPGPSRPALVADNSAGITLEGSELESLMKHESGFSVNQEMMNVANLLHQHQEGGPQFIRQPHAPYRSRNMPMSLRAQRFFSALHVPNTPRVLDRYRSTVFCAQYSADADMFVTASQDRNIRIYNTRTWRVTKRILTQDMGWAVLCTDFSPNKQWVAYSGWHNCVHLVNTGGEHEIHEALEFMSPGSRNALFSVKFSADSRELLGGSKDCHVYLYDIETKRRTHRVQAHHDDINNVAWADESSQVFFTGSDDRMIKVWDRRTIGDDGKPVGCLPGHLHGITYIDSRGDGRYLISNGKDQRIKLWDLRSMASRTDAPDNAQPLHGMLDYRMGVPSRAMLHRKLENDVSVMTYRGHAVAETLIRCKFSPPRSTGQKYIYTGSLGGDVVIYDVLTGRIVRRLSGHSETVRDLDWHPDLQTLITTGWDGRVLEWTWSSRPDGDLDDEEERLDEEADEAVVVEEDF